MIVVDASLATKWFVAEADSDRAVAFLRDHEVALCGPDILLTEVCQALVAAANSQRMTGSAVRAAIDVWLDKLESHDLPLHATGWSRARRGTDIALDLGHPLADCLYLALAIDLDCDLVTCDAKFRDKAMPRYPRIRLLAEIS